MTPAAVREHWISEWEDTFEVAYEQQRGDATAFTEIAETFGERAGDVVTALIRDPSLDWVNNRTPAWLANPANRTYLSKFLRGRPVARGDSEWRGPRTPGPSTAVVRHAGRVCR